MFTEVIETSLSHHITLVCFGMSISMMRRGFYFLTSRERE